ncbi:MAG: hypothetical protein IJP37_05295, partial [Clostridia bacterium]|nr:hypothetical protein [Clostridia bacterium]
ELTEGMVEDDSNRVNGKCGILKGALEADGVDCDKWNHIRFNALMEAARQVPAPVMFHTEKGADLEKFLYFLTDNGIDLDRVILCHLDRTHHDPALHKMLLQAGVRMNYDSVCRLKYLCNAKETALIAMMCEEGFASRITLSLDTTRARLEAYNGELGLDYILTTFINLLKERGISDADILKMTKTNGQQALVFGNRN